MNLRLGIVLFYVLISHLFLPLFNNGHDFLFFSKWNLFDGPPRKSIYDLAFINDGKISYFSRDHMHEARVFGIDTVTIRYLLNLQKWNELRSTHRQKLHELCACERMEIVRLAGSFTDFLILKKDLPIIDKVEF